MPGSKDLSAAATKARAMLQRAGAQCEQGRYRQAHALYLRARELTERTFGRQSVEAAAVLNDLGVLYKFMGRFAEAGRLYRRALAILQKAIGSDNPALATLYHNLGGL